jgi:hypothetical protein
MCAFTKSRVQPGGQVLKLIEGGVLFGGHFLLDRIFQSLIKGLSQTGIVQVGVREWTAKRDM